MKLSIVTLPCCSLMSPPSRGAWIEIILPESMVRVAESPPSRGAWIEIAWEKGCNENHNVAPLAGGVD